MSGANNANLRPADKQSTEKPQLKEIAVNTRGWCLEEPFPDHQPFELMNALPWTSTNLKAGIKKAEKTQKVDGKAIFRPESPGFAKTVAEEEEPESEHQIRYRIVGYTFPNLPVSHTNRCPWFIAKAHGVGTELPRKEDLIPWGNLDGQEESPPVIVVSPVSDEAPTAVKYCALICPGDDGLCKPHVVRQPEVFFRAEYRDGSTSNKTRDENWSNQVAAACSSISKPNTKPTETKIRRKARGGAAKLTVQPVQSLVNELTVLVATLQITPDEAIHAQIVEKLQALDPDLEFAPLPKNDGLRSFMFDEEFTEKEADLLVNEATEAWGKIDGLTVTTALELRKCLEEILEEGDTEMRYGDLYGFLAEGCFQLEQSGANGAAIEHAELGRRVIRTVHRLMPPGHKSPTVIPMEEEAQLVVFLQALVDNFKDMLRGWSDYKKQMMDSFGDQITTDAGPAAIWARFGDAGDTDSARLSLQELGRYVAGATLRGMTGAILEPLSTRIEVMEKVLDKFRQK